MLSALESALSHDRDKTSINGFSHLGLVEMTRKRTRESLGHILCCDCPLCRGKGRIKSVDTVCSEILREVTRVHKSFNVEKYVVYASKDVGRDHFLERVTSRNGEHTPETAAKLGVGSLEYELIEL